MPSTVEHLVTCIVAKGETGLFDFDLRLTRPHRVTKYFNSIEKDPLDSEIQPQQPHIFLLFVISVHIFANF